MNLLSNKTEKGFFNYKDCSKRMISYVESDFYPNFNEWYKHEISLIPYDQEYDIRKRKGARAEAERRIYIPTMTEALVYKAALLSKFFYPVLPSDAEDRIGKVDLKVFNKETNEQILIQIKSYRPKISSLINERVSQRAYFGLEAEYVMPSFHEDFLPYCTFEHFKLDGTSKIYELNQADIMLSELALEQALKRNKENPNGKTS